MATITLYGASDDLIEIDGDLREEFSYYEGTHYLGFSNGTVVGIAFDANDDGCWRIVPVVGGPGTVTIEQTDGRDDGTHGGYSDIATITGNITWAVAGDQIVRA